MVTDSQKRYWQNRKIWFLPPTSSAQRLENAALKRSKTAVSRPDLATPKVIIWNKLIIARPPTLKASNFLRFNCGIRYRTGRSAALCRNFLWMFLRWPFNLNTLNYCVFACLIFCVQLCLCVSDGLSARQGFKSVQFSSVVLCHLVRIRVLVSSKIWQWL